MANNENNRNTDELENILRALKRDKQLAEQERTAIKEPGPPQQSVDEVLAQLAKLTRGELAVETKAAPPVEVAPVTLEGLNASDVPEVFEAPDALEACLSKEELVQTAELEFAGAEKKDTPTAEELMEMGATQEVTLPEELSEDMNLANENSAIEALTDKKASGDEKPTPRGIREKETKRNKEKRAIQIGEDSLNQPILQGEVSSWSGEQSEVLPQKRKKRKKRRHSVVGVIFRLLLVIALVVGLAIGAMLVVYAVGDVFGLNESEQKISVEIDPDTSVTQVAELLKKNGVIQYPVVFRAYVKYKMENKVNFNYGTFSLTPSMSYDDLIAQLNRTVKSEKEVSVTIPEGFDVIDIAERLQENHVCTKADFLNAIKEETFDYEFLNSAYDNKGEKAYVLEGYLYPDTYTLIEGSEAKDVIERFLSNFDKKLSNTMRNIISNRGYTIDDYVTLSSIVQAEAPTKNQMLNVASVYWNRVNDSTTFPKLQADPTSKYAERKLMAEGFDVAMTDSYDTYKSDGLPPGAICNPGMDALDSTLHPNSSNYYYFCSDLTTGEFYYANSYSEHQYNLTLAGLTE